jgi:hypothetical protein
MIRHTGWNLAVGRITVIIKQWGETRYACNLNLEIFIDLSATNYSKRIIIISFHKVQQGILATF